MMTPRCWRWKTQFGSAYHQWWLFCGGERGETANVLATHSADLGFERGRATLPASAGAFLVLVPLMPQRGGEAPQQGDRVRHIGVLIASDENDPLVKYLVSPFTRALADLGWTVGRNVQMDFRGAGGDLNRIRALAQESVGLQPDIIVTGSTQTTASVQRETRTIPIV
jgi:hypothetical protein